MKRLLDNPRKRVVVLALACWLAVLTVMQVLPVPYVRLSPGPLFDVLGESDGQPVITIEGAQTFPTDGQLDMTTVSERGGPYGDLTLFEVLTGWIDPKVSVVPVELLYPADTTGDDAEQQGRDQFTDSQEKARIAALREVGEPVLTHPWVMAVSEDSPAKGILQHGDIVLSVEGRNVAGPRAAARIVRAAGPDAQITMDIRRGEEESTVQLTTVANPDDPEKGFLGISLGIIADSPVDVQFHLDDVGGPSAGLIFALGIVDKLTPGQLLEGRKVAGTGTMDYTGKVGAIGGIAQKMRAAEADGVELFLAPRDNCGDVVESVPPGLQIAAVRTLSEAVDVLEGKTPPAACPASG